MGRTQRVGVGLGPDPPPASSSLWVHLRWGQLPASGCFWGGSGRPLPRTPHPTHTHTRTHPRHTRTPHHTHPHTQIPPPHTYTPPTHTHTDTPPTHGHPTRHTRTHRHTQTRVDTPPHPTHITHTHTQTPHQAPSQSHPHPNPHTHCPASPRAWTLGSPPLWRRDGAPQPLAAPLPPTPHESSCQGRKPVPPPLPSSPTPQGPQALPRPRAARDSHGSRGILLPARTQAHVHRAAGPGVWGRPHAGGPVPRPPSPCLPLAQPAVTKTKRLVTSIWHLAARTRLQGPMAIGSPPRPPPTVVSSWVRPQTAAARPGGVPHPMSVFQHPAI